MGGNIEIGGGSGARGRVTGTSPIQGVNWGATCLGIVSQRSDLCLFLPSMDPGRVVSSPKRACTNNPSLWRAGADWGSLGWPGAVWGPPGVARRRVPRGLLGTARGGLGRTGAAWGCLGWRGALPGQPRKTFPAGAGGLV